MSDADSSAGTGADTGLESVGPHLESVVAGALADRDVAAFVHVGTARDPGVRYCQSILERRLRPGEDRDVVAVAFDGDEWLTETTDGTVSHPAETLADRLANRGETEPDAEPRTILTPAAIPHDAALYLERAGFDLASTAVLERARATKTADERERIAAAQAAAGVGIRRAAALLADATIADGRLVADGEAVTPTRLRTAVDAAIVEAGAFPAGNTVVNPDSGHVPSSLDGASAGDGTSTGGTTEDQPLAPGEPIVLETAPRGPAGYHGGLVRTLVVDSDGGKERRAHVAVTQAFRSAAAMLTAGAESVTSVEADLEAEIRAFGEDGAVETRVSGVGLESRERPLAGGEDVEPDHVVRLEAAVRVDEGQWLRIADLLAKGEAGERAAYLPAPSQSLDPTALLEE
ncbi:M24 family metallopeptidase [Haloterrigena alkaliphila]|uniref:M24 family metallopeptidase n=1 Tax=Haloterrigena alkaliphila TaxID=2816475 RepID=A0A8A2VQ23_9EURY|nr:M24 family metallopeptidase [Haloterrigena alkaliphila]QSX00209.1 M24 family metallopeptidase [Haloterrigena alkaliphila]